MHAVVTGASSGIGLALAKTLAEQGYQLTLIARREDILRELAATWPQPTCVVGKDLSELETSCDWVEQAEKQLGPIELLVNNAGMQYVESTLGISNAQAEKLLTLNLLTPLRLIRRVLPEMVRRRSGTVVNITSLVALNPVPWMYHYNASKAGLAAASESLRAELKGTGVNVVTVYPGPVTTPMEAASRARLSSSIANLVPTGTPEELAGQLWQAIAKKKARVVYPKIYESVRFLRTLSEWLTLHFTPTPRRTKT